MPGNSRAMMDVGPVTKPATDKRVNVQSEQEFKSIFASSVRQLFVKGPSESRMLK